MKTKIFLSAIVASLSLCMFAQTHYIDVQPNNSYPIGVTSSVTGASFAWTLTDGSDIITNDAAVNGSLVNTNSIAVSASATDGQTATISVIGSNGSCAGTAQTATIRVGAATFTATLDITTQSICEGDNSAAVTVSFSTTTPGATATNYVYYIDANGNGTQEATELDVTNVVASNTIPAATYSTPGSANIVIKSVSGTVTGGTASSPQTGVACAITINERPVLNWF